jgi:hypothetical protein
VCLDYYITSYDKNYDKIRSCLWLKFYFLLKTIGKIFVLLH